MAFVASTSQEALLAELVKQWPRSTLCHRPDATRYAVEALFTTSAETTTKATPATLSLHVSGTNFQIAVWRALLTIPEGQLASYSQIAQALGMPKSSRAVGNAVGANPIALLIPCHRVIQQSGALGGYRWGLKPNNRSRLGKRRSILLSLSRISPDLVSKYRPAGFLGKHFQGTSAQQAIAVFIQPW